jgi:N-acetylmuramoyl-L-alanine amidase
MVGSEYLRPNGFAPAIWRHYWASSRRTLVSAKRHARSLAILLAFLPVCLPGQPALAASCNMKTKHDVKIALDVGHTPDDPIDGALSARGVPEFDFNLRLANDIKNELVGTGFASTAVMVTHLSRPAGLIERVKRANDWQADLFLSVHHDSVNDEYLKTWTYQGKQRGFNDDYKGYSLFVSRKNARYTESLAFATALADRLLANGLDFTTHHSPDNPAGQRESGSTFTFLDPTRGIYRFDDFLVLRRSAMPAVILEAGVIVNRDEELALASPVRRGKIATAVAEAVDGLCGTAKVATYHVVAVATNDVLNIRSGPSPDLDVVGVIPPDGRGVRIVGPCKGQWCEIDYRGTGGWVNTQYLASEQ